MRPQRSREKFGMELYSYEKRMLWNFENFHKPAVWRNARCHHPLALELLAVGVIELVTVPVALHDEMPIVGARCDTAGLQCARVCAQAHRSSIFPLLRDLLLLRKNHDDWIRSLRVYLGRIRLLESADITGKLHGSQLHAVAETKVRDPMLTDKLNCPDLPFDPARAKAARDQHAVKFQKLVHLPRILLILLAIEPHQFGFPMLLSDRVL